MQTCRQRPPGSRSSIRYSSLTFPQKCQNVKNQGGYIIITETGIISRLFFFYISDYLFVRNNNRIQGTTTTPYDAQRDFVRKKFLNKFLRILFNALDNEEIISILLCDAAMLLYSPINPLTQHMLINDKEFIGPEEHQYNNYDCLITKNVNAPIK